MTTYERVKAVMEGFGWREFSARHYNGWNKPGNSFERREDNPLTPDVVRAIEQGMVNKGWAIRSQQTGGPGFYFETWTSQNGYKSACANNDTYGMAQLECAEKVLGLEVER